MERYVFRARLEPAAAHDPADRGWIVTFPDFGWGATQGETEAEALAAAADALEEIVAAILDEGGDLPEAGELGPSDRLVPLGGLLALKAALRRAMRQAGVSNVKLAQRLGCNEKEVRRLLAPRYGSKLPRLEAALAALGKRVVVEVRDAA